MMAAGMMNLVKEDLAELGKSLDESHSEWTAEFRGDNGSETT
jgi:hypothetical protein